MNIKPEIIALTMNMAILLLYLWRMEEPGRIVYWLGAVLLQLGLLMI